MVLVNRWRSEKDRRSEKVKPCRSERKANRCHSEEEYLWHFEED
jgi:hypothetical protein